MAITKALSVCQPWGWSIVAGFKGIENRPRNYLFRGRMAIHSSLSMKFIADNESMNQFIDENLYSIDDRIWDACNDDRIEDAELWQRGAVIGSVEVIDCVELDYANPKKQFTAYDQSAPYGDFHVPRHKFAMGEFCLVLANPRRYRQPFAAKGALNLWNLSPAQQAQIAKCERNLLTDPGEPARPVIEI
jgi:hypothetical protein